MICSPASACRRSATSPPSSALRSSLREGMRRLGDLGILDARQGSGTYIAELDLGDLLTIRLALEPAIARLAAARRSDADATRLDGLVAEMEAAQADASAFAEADLRLHAAVAAASHSLPARVLLDAIGDLLRHSRRTTAPDPAVRAHALGAVERLVAAIGDGDADAAEAAMRNHLMRVGSALDGEGYASTK